MCYELKIQLTALQHERTKQFPISHRFLSDLIGMRTALLLHIFTRITSTLIKAQIYAVRRKIHHDIHVEEFKPTWVPDP